MCFSAAVRNTRSEGLKGNKKQSHKNQLSHVACILTQDAQSEMHSTTRLFMSTTCVFKKRNMAFSRYRRSLCFGDNKAQLGEIHTQLSSTMSAQAHDEQYSCTTKTSYIRLILDTGTHCLKDGAQNLFICPSL